MRALTHPHGGSLSKAEGVWGAHHQAGAKGRLISLSPRKMREARPGSQGCNVKI